MFRKISLTHSTPLSVNPERVKRVEGLIVVASLFVLGMSKLSFAMMCGKHSEHQQKAQAHSEHEQGAAETNKQTISEGAVNVSNKICPVSGEEIDERLKVTYEYEGKVYNFCCASCIEEFKKDPEKYIKKIEEEKLQGISQEKEHLSGDNRQHSH